MYRIIIVLLLFTACSSKEKKVHADSLADSSIVKTARPSFDGLTCYESTPEDAMRMTQNHEYFAFSFRQGKIDGKGAGESLGDPYWTAQVHGIRKGDSLHVEISYRQEGLRDTIVKETWRIDDKTKRIYRNNGFIAKAQDYHQVESTDIPADMAKLMQ